MTRELKLTPQLIGDIARLTEPPKTMEELQREQERARVGRNREKWINALRFYGDQQIPGRWFAVNDAGERVFCAQGLAIYLAGADQPEVDTGEAKRIGMAFLGVSHDAWQRIASHNDASVKFKEIARRAERGAYWPVTA